MNAILCIIEQQLLHKIRKLQFYNIIYDKLSYTVYSECNYTCSNTYPFIMSTGWLEEIWNNTSKTLKKTRLIIKLKMSMINPEY